MARSLNKVNLIGNLTKDPELKYTSQGTAVCTFTLATNRQWVTEGGEKKEDAEFHRLVAWNKLAEICAQLLKKGRKVFIEGRLQTRTWQGPDGTNRYITEVVVADMILLDAKRDGEISTDFDIPEDVVSDIPAIDINQDKKEVKEVKSKEKKEDDVKEPEADDIPF